MIGILLFLERHPEFSRVAIKKLQQIHEMAHPGARLRRELPGGRLPELDTSEDQSMEELLSS